MSNESQLSPAPEDASALPKPVSFYELLDEIRRRPTLYFGRKSLRDFYAFLNGYHCGRSFAGATPSVEEEEFGQFDLFVQRKYRWYDCGGWAAKIAYYHWDDAAALDEFFKLLDEFREAQRRRKRRKREQ